MKQVPIFDGHNDLLTALYKRAGDPVEVFKNDYNGHLELEKMRAGGFAGGFFAVWIPTENTLGDITAQMRQKAYDLPLTNAIPQTSALDVARAQSTILFKLEEAGLLKICRSAADVEHSIAAGTIAAILHFEGAEAIDPDFRVLEEFHQAGLRSLGPVWSRPTLYGNGVPFRFPSSPDIGSGLTNEGTALIRKCNELRILIDTSHLNEAGFNDIAEISNAPIIATHSNAHALCPHSRNLTDRQLSIIGETNGFAGLNFATAMLRADGRMVPDVPFETLLAHLDHMIDKAGEDCVGMGSDFDGALVPRAIKDASGLQKLVQAMRDHGYGEPLIEKLCYRNWLRVLRETWGE